MHMAADTSKRAASPLPGSLRYDDALLLLCAPLQQRGTRSTFEYTAQGDGVLCATPSGDLCPGQQNLALRLVGGSARDEYVRFGDEVQLLPHGEPDHSRAFCLTPERDALQIVALHAQLRTPSGELSTHAAGLERRACSGEFYRVLHVAVLRRGISLASEQLSEVGRAPAAAAAATACRCQPVLALPLSPTRLRSTRLSEG